MNKLLNEIKVKIYEKCSFKILDFEEELEGKEYSACKFELNGLKIRYRNSKITPKKTGQFVTFWKRDENGITTPFNEKDSFDFHVISVAKEGRLGQFVFPKEVLKTKGIISTKKKDGKRGFRVYPIWDEVHNKQAEKTQKWQLDYFVEINEETDLDSFKKLYKNF